MDQIVAETGPPAAMGRRRDTLRRVDPLSSARDFLPHGLSLVPLLALPFAFLAGALARRRSRFAAVMVSTLAGALVARLAGPLSLAGPTVVGLLGSAAAYVGWELSRRRLPPPPPGSVASRVALVLVSLAVLVAIEVARPRVMPALSRRNPLGAVVLTGGDADALSALAGLRASEARPAAAVALYRAAFALDGRPAHLANAAFVENSVGRCAEARALAAEASRAAAGAGATPLDRHLAERARAVAGRCGVAKSANGPK
jgi:uncharacterized low-complexity protein